MPTILHVDMDAFYASVEQHDDPALRGKPVIVGGRSARGVVTAASYEARPFGVRSAMPMMEAMRRCPHAMVVPGRMARYQEVSEQVFAVFRNYTPLVQGLSLDEAFLDVSGCHALFGSGEDIARKIKADIRRETGLIASAGVASSKFVAKVASDLEKPDGLVVVAPGTEATFLAPLPIRRMWGVGPKAAAKLERGGFTTIGQLANATPERLQQLLGSWGVQVHALARGDDARRVVSGAGGKSIGAEETFARNYTRAADLERFLLRQSARVAGRLNRNGLWASCVTVKLKYANHKSKTRQKHLEEPVNDTDSIYAAALELLGRFEHLERGIRLTGVSASHLSEEPPAPTLFPDERKTKSTKIEDVTQALRAKFGKSVLKRGALVDAPDHEGEGVAKERLEQIVRGDD